MAIGQPAAGLCVASQKILKTCVKRKRWDLCNVVLLDDIFELIYSAVCFFIVLLVPLPRILPLHLHFCPVVSSFDFHPLAITHWIRGLFSARGSVHFDWAIALFDYAPAGLRRITATTTTIFTSASCSFEDKPTYPCVIEVLDPSWALPLSLRCTFV